MSKLTQKFVENQKVIVAFDADPNRIGGELPLMIAIGEHGIIREYDAEDDTYKVEFKDVTQTLIPDPEFKYSGPQWIGAECLVSA